MALSLASTTGLFTNSLLSTPSRPPAIRATWEKSNFLKYLHLKYEFLILVLLFIEFLI